MPAALCQHTVTIHIYEGRSFRAAKACAGFLPSLSFVPIDHSQLSCLDEEKKGGKSKPQNTRTPEQTERKRRKQPGVIPNEESLYLLAL